MAQAKREIQAAINSPWVWLRNRETVFSDSWGSHPCHGPRAHLPACTHTHPVGVVDDDGVWVAVVGRVRIGVISKPSQHRGDLGHVPHHVPRDVTSPLGERFQVHRLDDLVCGSLDPGERGQAGGHPAGSRLSHSGAAAKTGGPDPSPLCLHQLRLWTSHLALSHLLCTGWVTACDGKPEENTRQRTPVVLKSCLLDVSDFLQITFYLCD